MNKHIINKIVLSAFFIIGSMQIVSAWSVDKLKTNNLTEPLGIDEKPFFGWQLTSDIRGDKQVAYQIIVASSKEKADAHNGDIWNSGQIASTESNYIPYAGNNLESMKDYYWNVCVFKEGGSSVWGEAARFGTAMLKESDWKANWITTASKPTDYNAVEINLPEPILARKVRINITKLGLAALECGGGCVVHRVQLAEIQVYGPHDPLQNLAANCSTFMSDNMDHPDWGWSSSFLTDGVLTSTDSSCGASTDLMYDNPDVSANPIYIDIDLGSEMMIDHVAIYPRSNEHANSDPTKVCNFPSDYSIQTKVTDENEFTIRKEIKGQPAPSLLAGTKEHSQPMFGKNIVLNKPIKSAKAFVSGLGVFEFRVNGSRVTERVLEPGESVYNKTVHYSTYDITSFLQQGNNTFISTLGNGEYNNPKNDRYQKGDRVYGPLRFIAQIEIDYEDGTHDTVITDKSWKTADSPVIFSSWYGGEDYDARLELPGIYSTPYNVQDWNSVRICKTPCGKLKSHFYQPTIVAETWKAVNVNTVGNAYVIDFGRNFAGQYEISLTAPAGTKLRFYPAEILDAGGDVDQSTCGGPKYDTYTCKGGSPENWGPTFIYHGFRYLKVEGLPSMPTADMFTAKLIRAASPKEGHFQTSDNLLNQIHAIITRSIESNMYNALTDCPHREKLGWLEAPNVLYNTVADNFDISAWMPKITWDAGDVQESSGMVPTTAPEHFAFGGQFRDDPTWGGALIMIPWQGYLTYGDKINLEKVYPAMCKLMDYYAIRANNNLLDYGLGDWIAFDETTTVGFTVSCSYYQQTLAMASAAQVLGKSEDIAKYTQLATDIRKALNETYYNSNTSSYDSGSQAANAMALYYDIVPTESKTAVLQNLLNAIGKADNHLTTGEIALKPLFFTLADNGYNDLVYSMAMQKTTPGYGYFIENGSTTLPEYWDMKYSQNHAILGHIDGWFYEYMGGIRNMGVGYDKICIQPYFPNNINEVESSIGTTLGKITSNWTRDEAGIITSKITIPCNATAIIRFPVSNTDALTEGGNALSVGNGILSFTKKEGYTEIEIGSGSYTFSFQGNTLDFSSLNTVLTSAKSLQNIHVATGWEVLQAAINEGEKLQRSATEQNEIDQCIIKIRTAMDALTYYNYGLLLPALDKAKNIMEYNVAAGWETLQSIIATAQSLADTTASSQEEIDQCTTQLNAAVAGLTYRENVALNKEVIYSSSIENWGWYASNLTDGDHQNYTDGDYTGYSTGFAGDSDPAYEEYVGIKLGQEYSVNQVVIVPRFSPDKDKEKTESITFPVDFRLEASNNGQDWTQIEVYTDYHSNLLPQVFKFTTPIKANFIRLYCTKKHINEKNQYYIQIAEMEVY